MAEILKGPNDSQLAAIRKQLGEDQDRMEHNLELFKEWVDCQPHLPKNYDHRILPRFLRGCKHDMQLAKRKFQVHFSAKEALPELFATDTNSKELLHVSEYINIAALPDLTPQGSRISVFSLADPDVNKFDMTGCIQFVAMMFDIRLYEEHPYSTDIMIFDGKNFTALHCAKFISMLLKKLITVGRIAYPYRFSSMHVVNAPTMIEKILSLIRPYLHEKIRNRFVIHKSLESLHKHIPSDVLPKELGGTASTLRTLTKRWYKCIVDRGDWWLRQQSVRCAGPAPKGLYQSCGVEDSIGISGSFRKLEID